jgi:hypothetical protein
LKPAGLRSSRLVTQSRRLSDTAGPRYHLGAIVPSPVGMTMHASYWPGFPCRRLPEFYDVIVPTGYYTYHVKGCVKTCDESRENIRLLREKTGRNVIGFCARGSYPLWTTWGVREVRLVGPVIASPVARCYRPHEWAGEHPLSATLLSEGGQA